MTTQNCQGAFLARMADMIDHAHRIEKRSVDLEYELKGCMAALAKVRRSNRKLSWAAATGWSAWTFSTLVVIAKAMGWIR